MGHATLGPKCAARGAMVRRPPVLCCLAGICLWWVGAARLDLVSAGLPRLSREDRLPQEESDRIRPEVIGSAWVSA